MISYRIDYEDSKVSALFRKLADDMPEINRRILGVLSEEVVSRTQKDYLRGQSLRRVTGKLAQSITHRVYQDYAEVGTNIKYGAYHEFGFQGPVTVRDFTRRRGESGYPWPVRGHIRNLNYAGHPFMRPALDDVFQSGRAVVIIEGQLSEELRKRAGAA